MKAGRALDSSSLAWALYHPLWNKILLASCVVGVSIDPLFLYVLTINDDEKCLEMDHRVKNIAFVLRSITDFGHILYIISRLRYAFVLSKQISKSIFTGLPWFTLLIDVLAILPLPQVTVLVFFSNITGSKSNIKNILLLFQYVPRIFRVYLSAEELGLSISHDSLSRRIIWVRGVFFFFLYIIYGHVFGALWYFFSIVRETECWSLACKRSPGCVPHPFDCRANTPMKNLTYLNEFCTVNRTNSAVFDFGIFADAVDSRILGKTDLFVIFSRSFWWGLGSFSSFGQNLKTSSDVEENWFAILISTSSLVLFYYLIENIQKYMQLESKIKEERRKKSIRQPEIDFYLSDKNIPMYIRKCFRRYLTKRIEEGKKIDVQDLFFIRNYYDHDQHDHDQELIQVWAAKEILKFRKLEKNTTEKITELWMEKNEIPLSIRPVILGYVKLRMQEAKDVDIGLLHILPSSLALLIKEHMCFSILKKVPLLQNMDEYVFETIYKLLRPVAYSERSYIIRKGEPLDMILFITQGVVWTFGNSSSPLDRLQKGDYYGNDLIEWQLSTTISYSEFPISTTNLKSNTKVEAFALLATDLEILLSNCWFKFSQKYSTHESIPQVLKAFASISLQRCFRRYKRNRMAEENFLQNQYILPISPRL